MTIDITSNDGDGLLSQSYEKYRRELLVRRSKIACFICVLAVPSGIILDAVVYPDYVRRFAIVRSACEAVMLVITYLLFTEYGPRFNRFFSLLWVVPMVGYSSAMIALSEGILSPYYIGISMVVIGGCLLLPWTLSECAIACFMAILLYSLGCLLNWVYFGAISISNWQGLLINNFFIMILFFVICLASSHYSEQLRFHDFKLQFELDASKKKLEESYAKLEELDRAKSKFFANISHELRTPLTLILTPLDRLRSDPAITCISNVKETLDVMFGSGMRLLALINDLLDLVRLEEGRFELDLEPTDLSDFLPGLVSAVKETAEKNGLTITAHYNESDKLYVNVDKSQLEKVVLNLLFNAIKFTEEGGSIDVRAHRENGHIKLEVQDSGIGISKEKLMSIFERFWQDDGPSTRVRQGTGIGLALVKELVELHDGVIDVTSEEGVGTTVVIQLTALDTLESTKKAKRTEDAWLADLFRKAKLQQGDVPQVSTAAEPQAKNNDARHTLLVVEDEADMRRFLNSELEGTYNMLLASDGLMGLEFAEKYQPDLILTDMMMPKMDGISLCRRIKASPNLLPTKVILLTARSNDETKISALKAGADEFLSKPFSLIELKTRLANLLLNSQLERELQNQNITLQNTLDQLKETEAQLIQSERLSALGNLSAGIMHEINNPVNFMLTAVHVLRNSIKDADDDTKETIADIEDGLKRIRDIVRDLKGFAYDGGKSVKEECMPNDIIQPVKRLLAHELKNDVKLVEDIDASNPILCNRNQMIQLMLNLIQNAVQASEVNFKNGKDRIIEIAMKPNGRYYNIAVRDNGPGIEKANLAKIFDPFFTTKEVGKGMGLGLSICHTIVKSHDGKMSVDSKIDEFTEFKVQLPHNSALYENDVTPS